MVIDEHQQKQLEGGGGTITSPIGPSGVLSSSLGSLMYHQGEKQQSSCSTKRIIGNGT